MFLFFLSPLQRKSFQTACLVLVRGLASCNFCGPDSLTPHPERRHDPVDQLLGHNQGFVLFCECYVLLCEGRALLCCFFFFALVVLCLLRAVLCCAVLCCAVLCCAVLCCAVLCCAVLCCAVLMLLCPLLQFLS